MKLHAAIADPSKNITVIILDPIAPGDYAPIAKQIIEDGRWDAEQVAYVCKPQMGGDIRIEMMGGEFCGNAARSAALLYAKNLESQDECRVKVEISGCAYTLTAYVNPQEGTSYINMPIPKCITDVMMEETRYPVVILDGIIHVVISKDEKEFTARNLLYAVTNQWDCDAAGALFYDESKAAMKPLVYVRQTDSFIYERSCGSGTLALAAYLSRGENEGTFHYEIDQPGGRIGAEITRYDGRITKAAIYGRVDLRYDSIEVCPV